METVDVRAGGAAYPVHIEAGALDRVGGFLRDTLEGKRAAVVADARVAGLYGPRLRRSLRKAGWTPAVWVDVPPGERSKSLARARSLYAAFAEAGVDRWTPVVILGGGVTGDLGAFAAATFLRGVPVVQVPTTVVAQVDSSVGGTTAVDFDGVKNLIGCFHQPALVVADPDLLSTLAPREYRAGLAEVVKIAITLRPELLERLEREVEAVLERDPGVLTAAVRACVEAKAEVVGRDERDRDVRAILNYGHTVGHALEGWHRGRMRHGEAVAIGMHAAAWIGERLGVTLPEVGRRQDGLLTRLGLKLRAPGTDNQGVSRNLKLDKKVRDRRIRFVLTLQIGGASVWPHVPGGLVRDAVLRVTR
jgi:3-dehydroquinate synthase